MPGLILAVEVGNWEKVDVLVAGIAATLLLVVLIVSSVTAKAAVTASREARRANDAAEADHKRRIRPWIGIRDFDISRFFYASGGIIFKNDDGRLEIPADAADGDSVGYTYSVQNFGQSPATTVGFAKCSAHTLAELEIELGKEEGPGENTLFPSENLPQSFSIPFTIQKATQSGGSFYAGIRVVYGDSGSDLYATELIMDIDRYHVKTERRRTYEYQPV